MKKTQLLMFISCLLLSMKIVTEQKKQQVQQKVAQVRTTQAKPQSRVAAAAPTSKPSTPQAVHSSQESVDQLIKEFIKIVDQIKCSCGSSKKGKKTDSKTLCKHDKKHKEILEQAYKVYEKLHDATHGKNKSISQADNDKVKPSIIKLFECKNIKNKAWGSKNTQAHSSNKSQK